MKTGRDKDVDAHWGVALAGDFTNLNVQLLITRRGREQRWPLSRENAV